MRKAQRVAQRVRLITAGLLLAFAAVMSVGGILVTALKPVSDSADDTYIRFSTGGAKGPDIRPLITKDCEYTDPRVAPKFIPASVITDAGTRITFDKFYALVKAGNAPYALMFCTTLFHTTR